MAALTSEQILASEDILIERVECPEWEGYVNIATLDAKTLTEFSLAAEGKRGEDVRFNVMAHWIACTAVDDDGNSIFTPDQVEALNKKNAAVVRRLFTVCARLNGLDDEAEVKN